MIHSQINITIPVKENIFLRQLIEEDAPALFLLLNHSRKRLRRFLPWIDWNTREEHSLEFINLMKRKAEDKRAVAFGIFMNNQLCGVIDLHEWDHTLKKVEIGYWIGDNYEGKGLVSASCRALIDYVFFVLNLDKVDIRFALKNKRSSHIPIRLGFTKEHVLRQGTQLHGEMVDMVIMGLIKEDWERFTANFRKKDY